MEQTIQTITKSELYRLNTDEKIALLVKFVDQGVESWREAGRILVALIETDKDAYKLITKQHPRLSTNLLISLENVGRGNLLPELLLDSSLGARKLITLPVAVQKEWAERPVPVITGIADTGKRFVDHKPVNQLTRAEVNRAFSDTGVRSLEAQAKMARAELQIKNAPKMHRYDLMDQGKVVRFNMPGLYTYDEMCGIVEQMKAIRHKQAVKPKQTPPPEQGQQPSA